MFSISSKCEMFRASIKALHRVNPIFSQKLIGTTVPITCQSIRLTSTNTQQTSTEESKQIWTRLYRWATCFIPPASFWYESMVGSSEGLAAITATMGVTGLAMLSIYSALVANVIGIIDVDSTNENLRFAYVNFYGYKQLFDLKATDIRPPSEHTRIGPVTLFKVKSGENTRLFKLITQSCETYDDGLFSSLFEKKEKK